MRLRLAALLACAIVSGGAPLAQAPRSGIDVPGLDRSILPQDDLYRHVNARWLRRTVIPGDRVSHTSFSEISDKTERDLHAIIEEILARPNRPKGSPEQQIADLYSSTVDVARIEQLGVAAIRPQLDRIDAIKSSRDVATEAGYLSSIAAGGPFGGTIGIDPLNPGAPVVRVTQGGILLPDRDYYLASDPALAAVREKYALYLERIFTLAARANALGEADWMTPQTRREALEKLSALSTGVGHPARWRNYSALVIKPDDLLGNWQRALKFESDYRLGNVGGTAGGEWLFPPQTINAYYSPGSNEMVLPAAIFQPPVFDFDADDAVNYGAAGSLIGHEICHAFDERGRQFDGAGGVRDWRGPADAERFAARAGRLIAQLNAYEPLPGLRVNGPVAYAETMADLGGLAIAYRAYTLSLGGKRPPVIDGLTGEQRFFMGWAQIWRAKERDEYVRSLLQTSLYLPPSFRANAAAGNVDGFYAAFGIKPEHRLYRAPAERVRIW